MLQRGASLEAAHFVKWLSTGAYMNTYRQFGSLALIGAVAPLSMNPADMPYIINGSPPLINVTDIASNVDIRSHGKFHELSAKFPNAILWPRVLPFRRSRRRGTAKHLCLPCL
jgi:hypothetical protein